MIWGVSLRKNRSGTAGLHTTLDVVKHFSLPPIGWEMDKVLGPSCPFGREGVRLHPSPCAMPLLGTGTGRGKG